MHTHTVPEAPGDIKVMVSSSSGLYVSWLEPREPNGVITRYNLYIRQVNGRDEMNNDKRNLPATQTSYEAKSLQPHTEYQFWVTASTRVGEGKSSRVASQVTSSRVPAKIISFGGATIRPWKTPTTLSCLAVGSPRREWFKNDISLKNIAFYSGQTLDSGELIMTNLLYSDSGNYSCQVRKFFDHTLFFAFANLISYIIRCILVFAPTHRSTTVSAPIVSPTIFSFKCRPHRHRST